MITFTSTNTETRSARFKVEREILDGKDVAFYVDGIEYRDTQTGIRKERGGVFWRSF